MNVRQAAQSILDMLDDVERRRAQQRELQETEQRRREKRKARDVAIRRAFAKPTADIVDVPVEPDIPQPEV